MRRTNMFNRTMNQAFAVAAGVVIALQPMTAFAADAADVEIEVAEEVAAENTEEVAAEEETTEETVETAEVVEVETAETATVFDKKASSYLKTAAKNNALLSVNSFSEGLAATNQVSRCREMATKLLTFRYKYILGQAVIGTAYDMTHGDDNYIMIEYKDSVTGEICQKYFDFYMQDANGNNISNALKYHTVDRITIVEKDAPTGEKKIGFIKYPTFAAKSNGNVVMDINTYSQLISDEYIAYVESAANAQ